MGAEIAAGATDPGTYRFWMEDEVRFADLDPVGHVNNSAISVYFESVRVALFDAIGAPLGANGRSVVIARLLIEFRNELGFPARIRIGARVARVGRSSVTLLAAVFHGDACIATSEAVCVLIDTAARRPVEIPPEMRERLSAHA